MTSITAIASSGLQAAERRLQTSAHNIANGQTEGFHREQVVQQTRPEGGGVEASVTRSAQAGAALEQDVVDLLAAKNAFLANLAVFRTGNKMLGALLDSKA